eukprot:9165047-Karenia_brevis.AAC.1
MVEKGEKDFEENAGTAINQGIEQMSVGTILRKERAKAKERHRKENGGKEKADGDHHIKEKDGKEKA